MKSNSTINGKENSGFLKRNGRRYVTFAIALAISGGGKSLYISGLCC